MGTLTVFKIKHCRTLEGNFCLISHLLSFLQPHFEEYQHNIVEDEKEILISNIPHFSAFLFASSWMGKFLLDLEKKEERIDWAILSLGAWNKLWIPFAFNGILIDSALFSHRLAIYEAKKYFYCVDSDLMWVWTMDWENVESQQRLSRKIRV